MSLVDRIKKLEDRILYLEGISPEYFNTSNKPLSSFNTTVSLLQNIVINHYKCVELRVRRRESTNYLLLMIRHHLYIHKLNLLMEIEI